jgi:site-specific DNA recombinase
VPTSKGAKQWQPAVIGFMLRNQIYKGVLKYNRAIFDESSAGLTAGWEDPPLAIVDAETWSKAQQQLAANQRYAGRNNKRHKYLLKGLIKCRRCGGAYMGAADHGTRRYRCYRDDSRVSSTGQKCASGSVSAGPLEQAVWDAVTDVLSDQNLLREQYT